MAVQQITNKIIKKFDEKDGNFKPPAPPKKEEINGNVIEDDIYNEKTHTYQPDNGNLQMNEFMTGVLNKLDGLSVNSDKLKNGRAIEVDIKREIAIGKADISSIQSEEFKGKVKTKKDKLKALRNRRK